MKKITILFLFLSIKTFAQDYYAYRDTIFEALMLMNKKEYAKSIETYMHAFKIDEPSFYEYESIATAYFSLGNKESAYQYLKKAITKGMTWERIVNVIGVPFKLQNTPEFESLKSEYESSRKIYFNSIDVDLLIQLKEMVAAEQFVRANFEHFTEKESMLAMIDSINMTKLKQITETKGFPGSRVLGKDDEVILLIMHGTMYDEKTWNYWDSIMKVEIFKRNFSAGWYAIIADRRRMWLHLGKPLYDGDPFAMDEYGEMDDIEHVDERRASVGLMSLYKESLFTHKKLPPGYIYKGEKRLAR